MENKYEIESWEHKLMDNDDKRFFDQKMNYMARVIGNNNICDYSHHSISGYVSYGEDIFKLNGLKMTIYVSSNYNSYADKTSTFYSAEIRKLDNLNEILYRSYDEYVPGDWEKTFEDLYNEAINKENEPKVNTLKI